MLILNGSAEYQDDDGFKIKGERYAFNMFSIFENIEDDIGEIGKWLGENGWDEIDIKKEN